MSASTTRLNLTKPGGGSTGLITPPDIVDIDVLNANFDKIDAAIGAQVVTSTTLPSTPFGGQFVFETDTKRIRVFSGGQFVAPATERGSLTMYSGAGLPQLDAITDAVYGDTFYMTDPGLGNAGTGTIDSMTWEAFADSGVNMNWRVRDQIVADTKAHLDTFIAAVAAIGGTDAEFRVGGLAFVTGTAVSYRFTSTAGAYIPLIQPLERNNLVSTSVSATVGVANMPLLSFTAAALPYATLVEYTLILNATNNSASTVTAATAASGAGVVLTKPALTPFLSSASFTVGTEYIEMGTIAIPAGVACTFTVGVSAPAGAPGVLGSVRSLRTAA